MNRVMLHALACSSFLLCGVAHSTPPVSVDYVDGTRPAIVIFLPHEPAGKDSRSQVALAMRAIEACLGPALADFRMTFADRIVVRHADDEEAFELGGLKRMPGAVLVRPGANSRIVFAGGGPEALQPLIASAADDFFGAKCP